jgi:hypothetical protein
MSQLLTRDEAETGAMRPWRSNFGNLVLRVSTSRVRAQREHQGQ